MAEIVAATHNAYEAAHLAVSDALRHDVAVGLGGRQLNVHGVVAVLTLCHHVGEVEVRVGTAHQVGMMVVDEVLAHALCHAAQDAQDDVAALLLLCVQSLQTAVYLVLRVFANGACVEEDGVGLCLVFAQFVTGHLHDRGHHLRVGHVHLAAVCLNEKFLHKNLRVVYIMCKVTANLWHKSIYGFVFLAICIASF